MKRFTVLFLLAACLLLYACHAESNAAKIITTTLPIYEFTAEICKGTDLSVSRLITDEVSCVHDYSLDVKQLRDIETAELIITNGLGLEDFIADILPQNKDILTLAEFPDAHRETEHDHGHDHSQHDPHIWLMPHTALEMCRSISDGLSARYPQYAEIFDNNLRALTESLERLDAYGKEQLQQLSCRELITFHDGFNNLAAAYDLTILRAIEEESGSEASAAQLKELIELVRDHNLPAIFTEKNGSCSAAQIISRETGAAIYALDMAMSGDSYFDAMYHNIDTLKEALE